MAKELKKCPYCGKAFWGIKDQRYCGHSCANRGRREEEREQGEYDRSIVWERDESGCWLCPYQFSVGCKRRECNKCGWNPEVAKARTKEILRKLMAEEEQC
jgi:hypothetical protein